MAYYYSENNCNHENKIRRYQNKENKTTSYLHKKYQIKEKNKDSLIIDKNTVYEIDEDCMKKFLKSSNNKKKI